MSLFAPLEGKMAKFGNICQKSGKIWQHLLEKRQHLATFARKMATLASKMAKFGNIVKQNGLIAATLLNFLARIFLSC
jgi:hypothetical protein